MLLKLKCDEFLTNLDSRENFDEKRIFFTIWPTSIKKKDLKFPIMEIDVILPPTYPELSPPVIILKSAFYSKFAAEINWTMEERFIVGEPSVLRWILYMKEEFLDQKDDIWESICQYVN